MRYYIIFSDNSRLCRNLNLCNAPKKVLSTNNNTLYFYTESLQLAKLFNYVNDYDNLFYFFTNLAFKGMIYIDLKYYIDLAFGMYEYIFRSPEGYVEYFV